MRYELFLALRYLRGLKRTQPFVSVIAAISVTGVTLGVAALLVVLGVMSGFDADLEEKIIGANPHLVVQAEGGGDTEWILERVLQFPQVKAAAPFLQAQVLLRSGDEALGILLRGVDPLREPMVTRLASMVKEGWPPGDKGLIVGSELARRLGVSRGDPITVLGGKDSTRYPMVVSGEFTTGMYDYDSHLALAPLGAVEEFLGKSAGILGVGVRLHQAADAPEVKKALQGQLGYPYWVMSWMDLNKNLFAALKLEKVTMFIILTLIVLVACFNIIATLLMMVVKKTKEIGILKSLGATQVSIRRIFTWIGLLIGGVGTLLGTTVGLSLCVLLARYPFIQLPPEIYYIDRLPVRLQWQDALAVVLAAIGISWAATLYPAWVAARLQPAEAIRYE